MSAETIRCVNGQEVTRPDDFTDQMWSLTARILQLPLEQQVAVLESWEQLGERNAFPAGT